MDTPQTHHRADELFLWFADGPDLAEVERCDDAGCAVCAAAEPAPLIDPPPRPAVLSRAA